jgi:hypothetical protein
MEFFSLRDANVARQAEWDTGGNIDLSYSGNELAGEAGELIQAAVDLLNGGDDYEALREEIGDVIICCDLIGLRVGRPLITRWPVNPRKGHADARIVTDQLVDLAIEVGNVSNTIKKQERERFGMVGARGSLDDMMHNLNEIICLVHWIGESFGVAAGECVAHKFNLTSAKYGLQTKMAP